jgi:hypothetical protein
MSTETWNTDLDTAPRCGQKIELQHAANGAVEAGFWRDDTHWNMDGDWFGLDQDFSGWRHIDPNRKPSLEQMKSMSDAELRSAGLSYDMEGRELLEAFVKQGEEGASGISLDPESAQALALAIKELLEKVD